MHESQYKGRSCSPVDSHLPFLASRLFLHQPCPTPTSMHPRVAAAALCRLPSKALYPLSQTLPQIQSCVAGWHFHPVSRYRFHFVVPAPEGPQSAADLNSLPGYIEAAAAALFAGQAAPQGTDGAHRVQDLPPLSWHKPRKAVAISLFAYLAATAFTPVVSRPSPDVRLRQIQIFSASKWRIV